jgi:hypothetical protein
MYYSPPEDLLGPRQFQFSHNPRRRVSGAILCGAAAVLSLANQSRAVVGIDVDPVLGIDNVVLLNDTVLASSLYNPTTFTPTFAGNTFSIPFDGNYGQGSTLAVVDIGLINNSNPALTAVSTYFNINLASNPSSTPPVNLVGEHATDVAEFAAGYNPTTTDSLVNAVDFGIAPLATLWSGSIVDTGDPNGDNTQTVASTLYPFVQAMQVGVNGTTADVVNASIGAQGVPASDDFFSNSIDGLAKQNPHTTVVIAAGNSGPATGTVGSPAVAFNGITVAALASDPTLTYTTASDYSSRGPQDFYNPQTGVTLTGVRPAVDISAPGDYFVIEADPVAGQPGNYEIEYGAGTSFATPLVAGAVAQLTAYAHGLTGLAGQIQIFDPLINQRISDATDSRVIKAVLMNSADKTDSWSNGQTLINGVITTSQGLDLTTGAGRLNASRAADNYLNGNFDPKVIGFGSVGPKGWDLSTVTAVLPNIYDLGTLQTGATLSATLDWFADDTFDAADDSDTVDRFANLNLEVLEVISPGNTQLIAESDALYNNVQLLSFPIDTTADYELEVIYAGVQYDTPGDLTNSEEYALAWSNVYVPEPTSLMMLLPLGFAFLRRRRNVSRRDAETQRRREEKSCKFHKWARISIRNASFVSICVYLCHSWLPFFSLDFSSQRLRVSARENFVSRTKLATTDNCDVCPA